MKHFIPLLTAALLTPALALAANDGTLGTESSGDFEITYTVTDSPNIRISGFENVHFDYTIGDPLPPAKEMDICVYMDQPGTYGLVIDFGTLSDTNTAYAYRVQYRQQTGSLTKRFSGVAGLSDFSIDNDPGWTPSSIDDGCATEGPTAILTIGLTGQISPTILTTQTATATIKFTVTPD